jgi:hypothetical protein
LSFYGQAQVESAMAKWHTLIVDYVAGEESISVKSGPVSVSARLVMRGSGRRGTRPSNPSALMGQKPGTVVTKGKARKHQATTITAKEFHLWRFSIPEFLDSGGRHPMSSAGQ